MTPAQFALLVERRQYQQARELAVVANSHGASATPEDFLPKKKTGMGPEVFRAFERVVKEAEG